MEVRQEHLDHQQPAEGSSADSVPPSVLSSAQHEAQQVHMGPVPDTDPGKVSRGQSSNLGPRLPGWKGPKNLAPLLTGKARAAYVAMDIEETMDYVKVKNAVMHKYEINAESYRLRFRSSKMEDDETPKELQACTTNG